MLELMSYGLTGLVAILLVAFCFACKDDPTSLGPKLSSCSTCDARLRPSKPVERCTCAADSDAGPGRSRTGCSV
jgi:hypothetical protein